MCPKCFHRKAWGAASGSWDRSVCGQVLRAKGIVETETGFLNVQFLPGEHRFEKTNLQEHELCVIGHDLNRAQITAVFEGVC
ncbi:MAG: GTP-binding protein [Flavonifractor plautii]